MALAPPVPPPSAAPSARFTVEEQEALLDTFAELNQPPPPGVLDKYIIFRVVKQPQLAREYLICEANPTEGMLRFVHDELRPVVSHKTFPLLRSILTSNAECEPLYWLGTLMVLYVANEGVRQYIEDSWTWTDRIGSEVHKCIKVFIEETVVHDLLEAPFLPDSAMEFIRTFYTMLWSAIGLYDVRQIIRRGVLRPIPATVSRNMFRDTHAEMTQRAKMEVEQANKRRLAEASQQSLRMGMLEAQCAQGGGGGEWRNPFGKTDGGDDDDAEEQEELHSE